MGDNRNFESVILEEILYLWLLVDNNQTFLCAENKTVERLVLV